MKVAPAVLSGVVADRPAVQLLDEIGDVIGQEIDERRRRGECFLFGERSAVVDRLLGEIDVSLTAVCERPDVGRNVFGGLLRHHLVDLFAARRDRMSCADVCAGRHGGDVGCNRENKTG
jgi:hypothetical protein